MDDLRPSATALMVALSVLRRGRRHQLAPTVVEGAAHALRSASPGWRLLYRLALSARGRRLLDSLEAWLLPALADHHCARKRWLADRLRSEPSRQRWIWLGCGFDRSGRSLLGELAVAGQPAPLELIELDHPASRRLRQNAMAELDHEPGVQSLDFRWPDDWPMLLALAAERSSTLVLEGVAMYWSADQLMSCLSRLAQLPRPPRLLFTALAAEPSLGTVDRWLRLQREPFAWRLDSVDLRRQLAALGYHCTNDWRGHCLGEYGVDMQWLAEAVPTTDQKLGRAPRPTEPATELS